MSFRSKVFLIFLITVLASVSLVAYGVTHYTRMAFEERDRQLTEALAAQFRKEYNLRRDQIAMQVKNIADAELTYRVAIDLAARPNLDQSLYAHEAVGAAQDHDLEFCEFVSSDGTIISSTQFPTHIGHKNEWVTQKKDWNETPAFLRREELPDSVALGVFAVRAVNGGNDKYLYIIGGKPLDSNFLSTLVLPAGLRALLYRNLDNSFVAANLTDTKGPVERPEKLQSLIDEVRQQKQPAASTVNWDSDAASAETFHAIPLLGRENQLLGVLLVGSSRRELVVLTERIVAIASIVAAGALLAGLLMSFWLAARITRPVEELAEGAREVAAGRWETRIDVKGIDEVGQLGIAFNDMTRTLATQRERLLQTERVAAWRELARRLAHELRNPLFPLQITVENLQRAKQLDAKQFQEVFNESTATLKAELTNLNSIVGRFSDFSKMPAPQFAQVDVNEALRNIIRLFEPQFNVVGKPPITPRIFFDRSAADDRCGCGVAASRVSEPGAQRGGRDADGGHADAAHFRARQQCADRDCRHGQRTEPGRVRAAVYAVLHDEASRHRAGTGDRAVGDQRSSRDHSRFQRRRPGHDLSHRVAAAAGGQASCAHGRRYRRAENGDAVCITGRGVGLNRGLKVASQSASADRRR